MSVRRRSAARPGGEPAAFNHLPSLPIARDYRPPRKVLLLVQSGYFGAGVYLSEIPDG